MKTVRQLTDFLLYNCVDEPTTVTIEETLTLAHELKALLALRPEPTPRVVRFPSGSNHRILDGVYQTQSAGGHWFQDDGILLTDIQAYLNLVANPNEPIKSPLQAASAEDLVEELRTREHWMSVLADARLAKQWREER